MKQLTIRDIRNLEPCYDPAKYLPEDWTGTVTDILKMTDIPVDARLWTAVRSQFLSDKTLQYFALACARTAEKYSTDERVKKCNDVTEAYLKGEATKEDLDAAAIAPSSSATSAATFAVSASRAAADVAYSASRAAVYVSATYAAYAAYSAVFAATSASISPQEEQRLILIKLIEENEI